jgi:hypothetical protein
MKLPNKEYVELIFKQRELLGKLYCNYNVTETTILWKEFNELAEYLSDKEPETNQLYFSPEKLYLKKKLT